MLSSTIINGNNSVVVVVVAISPLLYIYLYPIDDVRVKRWTSLQVELGT